MLQLHVQTSDSKMIPISDLRYIYDLAKCSKCSLFIVYNNKLYGTTDDCTCIHEIDIPFLTNSDLMFRIDQIDKDMIFNQEQQYFIPYKFNWTILPEKYWDMYIGGDIEAVYSYEKNQYILIDKTIKAPIQDQIQMHKFVDCDDVLRYKFLEQLEGYFRRTNTLLTPEIFTDIQTDPNIRTIYDNKVSIGRVLCNFKNSNINIAFYLYKSLIPLAKSDTLDMEIRFDAFNKYEFLATFKPIKKKNPLTFNTYGVPFREKIHCMFTNII